jgi:hypothetical protein
LRSDQDGRSATRAREAATKGALTAGRERAGAVTQRMSRSRMSPGAVSGEESP